MGVDEKNRPIFVPERALVECPLVQKRLRKVRSCLECKEYYRGLKDRFPGDKTLTFGKRYIVVCAYPTGRPVFEIEGIAAEVADAGPK